MTPTDALAERLPGLLDRLRSEPQRAARSYSARTELGGSLRCEVSTGDHTFVIDERPSIGGTDEGASPIEAVLGVLAACQAITYRVWATTMGIALDHVAVTVDGDIDLNGFFGLNDATRAGFTAVRMNVALRGPETDARYRELADAVDRHCPVFDLIANTVPVDRVLTTG
jgi:putative redox protein